MNTSLKILFVTPHLSTGGGPQYLLRKIKELDGDHEIYCIEYSNVTGGVLVVQRNQIEEILKNKLITLDHNKLKLIEYIKNIQPDIIHFEELPEYFCDNDVAKKIYTSDRKYKIIETSHDSSFDVSSKRYFPDRFIFVSEYQMRMFSTLNIPMDIVEYPIEYKIKKDRESSLVNLGLDPNKIHFLNVGLFTSRKNQSEIIEYAKKLINEPVQFHFVGNQADNFKWYWEPLMKNFPSNCKWWGERKDVDTFYNAMDVFLFTSKGTNQDKETNPLVIREAIGWNMPILMYNLPVYCGMYDKYRNINWLSECFVDNINKIKSFCVTPTELFNISFDCETNKFDIKYNGVECLNDILFSIKDYDSKVCIYSCTWDRMITNSSVWIIPLPKHVFDFKNNDTFGGFLIQIFDSNKNIIFKKEIIIKNITIKKPVIEYSDTDPIFMNYNEFFIENIYDDCKISNFNTCIDIGANVGLFTKYLKTKQCTKILCYEPNKFAFAKLSENLKNEKDVTCFNLAISHNTIPIRLYVDKNNSLISSACINGNNFYDIQSVTIKNIINDNKLPHIDLIKIDIEGMEFELIEQCDDEVFEKIDRLLIEYHDFYFKDGDIKVLNMKRKLESVGYLTLDKHKFIFAYKKI